MGSGKGRWRPLCAQTQTQALMPRPSRSQAWDPGTPEPVSCLCGIEEGLQGSPPLPQILIRPCSMHLGQEATMGFEPMIRVLQDPAPAIQTLARLWPDSV
jgi:hypothetical protein